MPPLLPGLAPVATQFMVPVVRRPHSSSPGKINKGKAPVRHPPRRQYDDEPLPIKPDTTAPKNARIVGRQQEHDGALVGYQITIGEVEINDVGVDDILDYVSALDLERFEIGRFHEEAEIFKVLEQNQDIERKAKLARAAERARTKGAVFVDEGGDSAGSDGEAELQLGKHGRARPDYSKFYKKPIGKGKGKQIFEDFADEVMASDSMQTNDEESSAPQSAPSRSNGVLQELPKRRRRRRDPLTGELMPLDAVTQPKLSLEEKVRHRRKRHPLTGELMPIGWQYDPKAERNAFERRRDGHGNMMKEASFKRLSISEHHEAKRQRLDTESAKSSSPSPVPTKAEIMEKASSQHRTTPKGVLKTQTSVVDLMSSDDEAAVIVKTPSSSMKPRPREAGNSMMRGTIESTGTTSAGESSPEPQPITSLTRPTATSPSASQRTPKAQQPMTSILSPSAARTSSTDPVALDSGDESSDEVEEGEWFIESILGHRMSDPRTHPAELGCEPVMLYSVKWVGYEKPTWEPMESFGDRSLVDGYRKSAGLKALPADEAEEQHATTLPLKPLATTSSTATSISKGDSRDMSEDDEVEYEIERITAHHLSDPRTHPARLGKTPIMLYHVKWKGFNELTWEPETSFDDDAAMLMVYKRTRGLK